MRCARVLCVLFVAVFALQLFVSCAPAEQSERLQIVSTVFPPYDFARQIAGDRADCHMLLGTDSADVHAWEPTASQFAQIAEADLFLCIGGESEAWVDTVVEACGLPATRVVRLLQVAEADCEPHDHGEADHDHAAHTDEHIWTNPENAKHMAEAIFRALCAVDTAGEAFYAQNAAVLDTELSALCQGYANAFADKSAKTVVVADKFPFRHLANAYNITYFSAFPGCASDTEPSLQTMQTLIEQVRTCHIPVVLYIAHGSDKLARTVCESTGAKMRALHACHTVSAEELASGATYCALMWENLEILQEALGRCN